MDVSGALIDGGILLAKMLALLLGVSLMVCLLQRRLGNETIRRWMGGPPKRAALKGIALGFVTPFCTYSAIPVLIGMRQAGIRAAGYTAFIVAAPVVDPLLIGALVIIIGPTAAVVYTAVAFTAALALALLVERIDITAHLKPLPVPEPAAAVAAAAPAAGGVTTTPGPAACAKSPEGSPGAAEPPWEGLATELGAAWWSALALLRRMALLVVIGIAIGLALSLFVPSDFIAAVAGSDSPLAIPIAATVGIPFYVGTELFIPIGDALHNSGVGVGAIVVLTIAGAGANLPEFALLTTLANRRVVGAFFGYVFAVAVCGGLVAELIV